MFGNEYSDECGPIPIVFSNRDYFAFYYYKTSQKYFSLYITTNDGNSDFSDLLDLFKAPCTVWREQLLKGKDGLSLSKEIGRTLIK